MMDITFQRPAPNARSTAISPVRWLMELKIPTKILIADTMQIISVSASNNQRTGSTKTLKSEVICSIGLTAWAAFWLRSGR